MSYSDTFMWCVVGDCNNTTESTPDKFFIKLPDEVNLRNTWLRQARKNPKLFLKVKHIYFCEDHFDLPNDMENYNEYQRTKSVECIRMKPNCIPTKFKCWSHVKPRKYKQSATISPQLNVKLKRSATATGSGRQQVSRHLKKGVVPSVFPWNKTANNPSLENAESEENAFPLLNNSPVLDKTPAVSPQKDNKKLEIKLEPQETSEEKSIKTEQRDSENQTDKPHENVKLRDRSVRLRNRRAYIANRKCSIPHCNSRPSKDISLHPCPNNSAVRNEWAEALHVSYQYIKNMVACSLHFISTDFFKSKQSGEKVLKQNAVPSRNLPNRKRISMPGNNKTSKKDVHSKDFERQMMTTNADEEMVLRNVRTEKISPECRACLKKLDDKKSFCNIYQAWAPPWKGMEATIAEDLAKLANIEISTTDRHSKVICEPCYKKLLDAANFASKVRRCDLTLRQRYTEEFDPGKVWPKPIQVDKTIDSSVLNNPMEIEIKQEVVSDDEYNASAGTDNNYVETELANLDIKIEPEEFVEPPPMNIMINGTISLDPLNSENKEMKNGTEEFQEEQYLDHEIKQEPQSEEEQEVEQAPDLPLECLLCTKSFNSVTGLKAHVIAQHSYKTVKRKSDGSISPERKRTDKYHCAICRRSFLTSTDLMVHETCHNKHACYGCTEKFDSFTQLTNHRKRCKASIANSVQKLKTLNDVKRPMSEEKDVLKIEIEKVESEAKTDTDIEMSDVSKQHITANDITEEATKTESKDTDDDPIKAIDSLLNDESQGTETAKDVDIFDVESKLKELLESDEPITSVHENKELTKEPDNVVELSLQSTLEQD